jgi:hypothetical protein
MFPAGWVRFYDRFKKKLKVRPTQDFYDGIYIEKFPSHQNAIDIIPSWNHGFPEEAGVKAGAVKLYQDGRIKWAIEQFGDLSDKRILELGPLEAAHTSILDRTNPRLIDAIEANKLAFMRCLVAKQIYEIKNATFYLGDFVKWLEDPANRYDFIVACGVLYHMKEPVHLIELMAKRADSFFIWTHYYDEVAMPPSDPRRAAFRMRTELRSAQGMDMKIHERSYFGAEAQKSFCGGPSDTHYWMERQDILGLIKALGFHRIQINDERPDHPGGPAFSIYASRQ